MKTRVMLAMVLAMLLALPLALYAQESTSTVVQSFWEAVSTGDVEQALAVVGEETTLTVPKAFSGEAEEENADLTENLQYVGKAEIEAWIEGLTAVNAEITLSDCYVPDDSYNCWVFFTSDALAAKGVDKIRVGMGFTVSEGKIQSSGNYLLEPEPRAELMAASGPAAAATPETMAETGGGSLPPIALTMVLGGLMVAGGLGMQFLKRRRR